MTRLVCTTIAAGAVMIAAASVIPAAQANQLMSIKPQHLTLRAALGSSDHGSITVTNRSGKTLSVRLTSSPPDSIDIANEGSTCTIAADNVLADGASCTILVRYSAREELGRRSNAELLITARDPQTDELLDSEVVKITGTTKD